MADAALMAEVWRGPFLESVHYGHAVISDVRGNIVASWGDPFRVILPRSSVKMLQALPLVESGAATTAGLSSQHLALASASHNGAAIHREPVARWLADQGLSDEDLRCGAQQPRDKQERAHAEAEGGYRQLHNNCSGKHTGFLTLGRHLRAGPEYVDPEHPVQKAVRAAFEEMTGAASPGYGIDGCSAPNFAARLSDVATAMARMADPSGMGPTRAAAAHQIVDAMMLHPELVAGEGRACTELMRAAGRKAAVKTGAEGVFVAILPEAGLGIALKIDDGATRAAEAAMAALLVGQGILAPEDPAARRRMAPDIENWRGLRTGVLKSAPGLSDPLGA